MMRKLRESFLFCLYERSKDSEFFHEWFRRILLELEIPLINRTLKIFFQGNKLQIYPRHSLIEQNGFNVFMSDIDLTLVIDNEKLSSSALKAFSYTKILFPNLGEPEVLTVEEFQRPLNLESSSFKHTWCQIFQIRKIEWQKNKKITSNYENEKVKRGMRKCDFKLRRNNQVIRLNDIAHFDLELNRSLTVDLPYYSDFLSHWISLTPVSGENTVICPNENTAREFITTLPSHEEVNPYHASELRKYLILKEINMSKCQKRILQYENQNCEHIDQWIMRLENQLHLGLN